ncbi:hypothetical protein BIW11_05060 [Tropilaelaps mercedesae]|uniref:Uncharacterized protein n=1 Tax=Tropilaelaps mercedesae TaxID=418985 RepID=A0A1V9Y3Y4_9ACAR|nr:hypothetical protein BIW11_05060 [Tropilaelaps mercedesae]
MDCVFLKDDTIVSGEFVTSQLKASLTYINEELLKNGRVTGEPIEVTSVKKLQFLELFTLAEILGAILLLLVIVGVALTAGSEAALGIVKFINQKIKKSEVVWSPVKLTEMTVRQGLAQQCMAVNQSENDEATLSHIVSETQLENSVTECGPVRPKTFKPIEEIMSC